MWNPAPALRVSREDREWLEALVRSGKTPQRVALRAHVVLRAAEGRPNHDALAKELGISRPTVLLWWQRYIEAGVAGLLKRRRARRAAPCAAAGAQEAHWPGEGGGDRECDAADHARGRDALERAHGGEAPVG